LFAIELIEYRKAKGIDKSITQKQVGAAYGVSGTTVRLWKGPLCIEPGQLEVSRRIEFAKCTAASEKRNGPQAKLHLSKRYGNEALEQAGAKFKEILKGG